MSSIINRRAVIGQIAGAASLAIPAITVAAVPADPDAEIMALSSEIVRRKAEADRFEETYVCPLDKRFHEICNDRSKAADVRSEEALAFGRESGLDAAAQKLDALDEARDGLFNRLMDIPATTQAGRAAKVRALLTHVMRADWRGPASDLNWEKQMARALLGEFAGMSAGELEAV